jgi:hypothetical protein
MASDATSDQSAATPIPTTTSSLATSPWPLATLLLFGLACTQAPLYYSNQNQYFLHGMAQGGRGLLADDWLANTADPTPVFSALVAFTYRYLGEFAFYVEYLVLLGIYAGSLLWLFAVLYPGKPLSVQLAFAALLMLIHSGLVRLASGRLLGTDYPWYFQTGLAGQYILGPTFQPSTFGVLLVLSVALFVAEKPLAAAVAVGVSCTFHSTYLLSGGILICSYLYVLIRNARFRQAAAVAVTSLLLVVPVLAYNLSTFAPRSADSFDIAAELLANFRIPHHCVIARWFDIIAGLQIAWVGLAIYLSCGSRLFPVLVISSLLTLGLTLVQLATRSNSLALLFPWRPSSVLVPLATAVIVGRVVIACSAPLERLERRSRFVTLGSLCALLLFLAGSGLFINIAGLAYQIGDDESAMLDFVSTHKEKGDVYLIPVELPRPPGRPGAWMSDFKSLADRMKGRGLIPIELQQFRLATGAPIFVDFKAIPYRDDEVLEWYNRLQVALAVYDPRKRSAAVAKMLLHSRITHVVVPVGHPLVLPDAAVVYHDRHFRIYRLAR